MNSQRDKITEQTILKHTKIKIKLDQKLFAKVKQKIKQVNDEREIK